MAPFAVAGCRGNHRRAVVRRLGKFDLRPCPLRLRSSLFCGGACSSWTSLTRLLRPARCRVLFDKVVVVPVVLCNGVPQVQSVSLSVASERHVTSMTHRIACPRAVRVTALPYFTRLPVSFLSQQTRETGPSSYGVPCPSSGFQPFPLFTGVWQFSKILGSAFPSAFCRREWDLSTSGFSSSQSSQNTVEVPQMHFLDKLVTKRLMPSRGR